VKKALLVIDIQKGLTLKKKLYRADDFISTVNRAIQFFRDNDDFIIFVHHQNKMLPYGSEDWQLDDRLSQMPGDLRFDKSAGNAFSNPQLVQSLHDHDISDIVICGLVTHGCIKYTCLGAKEEGFRASLLFDGHTNWHPNAQAKIVETESELEKQHIHIFSL